MNTINKLLILRGKTEKIEEWIFLDIFPFFSGIDHRMIIFKIVM